MNDTTATLAEALMTAHKSRSAFKPVLMGGRPLTCTQAYAVQDKFVEILCEETGSSVVGYKIGLTSPAMQEMCGIKSPVHGRIISSRAYESGSSVSLSHYKRVGLEFEIAVKVGKDILEVPSSHEEVSHYVEAICPAIELIDDSDADYSGLDAKSLIADNAWNAGIVTGAWYKKTPDNLASLTGRIFLDDTQIDEGRVGDALDHPFASIRWLSEELARQGRILKSGMVVMTGSIVQTRFPDRPGRWRYEIAGLGDVELMCGA
jgi:2-keto-4-pentenoate hydratase